MDYMTKEAIRYLGYGRHAVDDKTLAMIADSFESLRVTAGRKSIHRIFDLQQHSDHCFAVGAMEMQSKALSKNLTGCTKIVFFGATMGLEVDRLIARFSLTDMAKAVILQACSAAMLEDYCDRCQESMAQELQQEGLYLRPRFSPGYGDFDMTYQAHLMHMLDCAKGIGLTMTKGYMMTPTKSVTAVIGASPVKERCRTRGCKICDKKDCKYRRDFV